MPRMPSPWFRASHNAWYIKLRGRQVPLGVKGRENRAEAMQAFYRLMAAEGQVAPGPAGPAVALSVAALCDLFLGYLLGQVAATTHGWYVGHLQSFCEAHGRLAAAEVKPLHVSAWLGKHPGWNPSTRRGAITAVKRCWRWAAEEGHLAADPLAKVRRPKMGRRSPLPPEDAERVLAAVPDRLRAYLAMLAETGARPGELAGATAAGLDERVGTLRVVGKAGERTLFLTAKALDVLRRLAAERPEGPLFLNARGRPWNRNAVRCALRRVRARTGIAAKAYQLRHLFASRAIERGVDSLIVAELMGHSDTSMLQEHYAHHRAEMLRRAAEKAAGDGEVRPPAA